MLYPRGQGDWNPHASYHADGRYHSKSYDQKFMPEKRQPIAAFKGTEHLGIFSGHSAGMAVCVREEFTNIICVPPGVLTSYRGAILVDFVEPCVMPHQHHQNVPGRRIVVEETFRDALPWVVIAVAAQDP